MRSNSGNLLLAPFGRAGKTSGPDEAETLGQLNTSLSRFRLLPRKYRPQICHSPTTAHRPSFSRMWSEPVPKLSSPQILRRPASIRLPKNFQPFVCGPKGSGGARWRKTKGERGCVSFKLGFAQVPSPERELVLRGRPIQRDTYLHAPVGTSKISVPSFFATRSMAPLVGMERARPLTPPRSLLK